MRISLRRSLAGATAGLLAGALLLTTSLTATEAAITTAVAPSRIIRWTELSGLPTIAPDGTLYVGYGPISVWSPSSNGRPTVVKQFTGMSVSGQPTYLAGSGLAWADSSGAQVVVMDPAQPGGAFVATRTITGAATKLESPAAAAWASDGSLWVADSKIDGVDGYEFLRFAPGANGNAAPVQRIAGPNTGFVYTGSSTGFDVPFIAALPGHGLAASPAGVRPSISIFTGSQSGDVKPAKYVRITTPSPSFLAEGVAADSSGRIYVGVGDLHGDRYGFLQVYNSSGTKLLELSGAGQDLRIPLAPSVSPGGTLSVVNATIIDLGGTSYTDAQVEVFKPLFAKAGPVRSLKVTKTVTTQTVSWLVPTNKGGTTPSYRVVVRKGTKILLARTVAGTRLAIARRSLPKGTLKVTVSAVNAGGTGPAVSKLFTN